MMMMVIVLGWKVSKSKVVVLEEGDVCNQGEGVVDVDLERAWQRWTWDFQSSNVWNGH